MAVAAHATFQPLGPVAGGLSSFSSDAEAGISRKTAVDARKVRQLIESLDIEAARRIASMREMAKLKVTLLTDKLMMECQKTPSAIRDLTVAEFCKYGGDQNVYNVAMTRKKLDLLMKSTAAPAAQSTQRSDDAECPPTITKTATKRGATRRKETLVSANPGTATAARRMTRAQARESVAALPDPYATPVVKRPKRAYRAPDPDKTPFIDPRLPGARGAKNGHGTLIAGQTLHMGRISIVPNNSGTHNIAVPLGDGSFVSIDPEQSPSSLPSPIRDETMLQIKALHDQLSAFINHRK